MNALSNSGNDSVLGLVDWDGNRNPSGRVHVLAHNVRDGLENCIFDPLLIALQVARDARNRRTKVGITNDETYLDVAHFAPDRLQAIVVAVCQTLGTNGGGTLHQRYIGGLELDIPSSHLTKDDHDLENAVLAAFPEFNAFNRHSGDLLRHFATTTMTELPQFIPDLFTATFIALLNAEL
ncbi:MAG: hypothetical protein AAGA83_26820 [Cyanobacteria bacterium P01_F01_bin.116]